MIFTIIVIPSIVVNDKRIVIHINPLFGMNYLLQIGNNCYIANIFTSFVPCMFYCNDRDTKYCKSYLCLFRSILVLINVMRITCIKNYCN